VIVDVLDGVIDDALELVGWDRGWRPEGGEIQLGFDPVERDDASDVTYGMFAAIYEALTYEHGSPWWMHLGRGSDLDVMAVDRLHLEQTVGKILSQAARLVVWRDDGAVVELQECFRGPLQRFDRVEEAPLCTEEEHEVYLELAHEPGRYNTQQHIMALPDLVAHFEPRLDAGAGMLGAMRRGELASDFSFEKWDVPWTKGSSQSWSTWLHWVIDPLIGTNEVGVTSRCMNGCGLVSIGDDEAQSWYWRSVEPAE